MHKHVSKHWDSRLKEILMRKFIIITLFITFYLKSTAQEIVIQGLPSSVNGIIFNNNELYFATYNGTISKININESNPTPTIILTGLEIPNSLALNGNDLYISEQGGNKISKINISDTNPTATTVISGLNHPDGLALNGNDLYIAERDGNKISKINISDTNPIAVTIVSGINKPTKLLLDNNDLYTSISEDYKVSKINILDINPTVTTVLAGISYPVGLGLYNNILFVAEPSASIVTKVNITNIPAPLGGEIAFQAYSGWEIAINGDYIYYTGNNAIIRYHIDAVLSTASFPHISSMKTYPNPSTDFIYVLGLNSEKEYKIYNLLGQEIRSGKIYLKEKIDIQNLTNGLYFLKFNTGNSLKFIKE